MKARTAAYRGEGAAYQNHVINKPSLPGTDSLKNWIGSNQSQRDLSRTEEVLANWEGVVETIDEDSGMFTAKLYDLDTGEMYPSKAAKLPIDDISDDDRSLLREGAVFYFTVGYSLRAGGRKERFMRIEFRRLPAWTQADLERAERHAQLITSFMYPES